MPSHCCEEEVLIGEPRVGDMEDGKFSTVSQELETWLMGKFSTVSQELETWLMEEFSSVSQELEIWQARDSPSLFVII